MKKSSIIVFVLMFVAFSLQATWKNQFCPTANNLNSVWMVNPNLGWIVGDKGTILKYNETSWTLQNSNTVQNLTSVCFVDALHGWAVGDSGTILRTIDGVNWTKQTSGTVQGLNDVTFTDATHGWAVGNLNTVLKTNDGASWIPVVIPPSTAAGCNELKRFMTIHFKGSNGIIAGGNGCGGGGAVFITTNGGDNWTFNTTGIGYPSEMNSAFVLSQSNIWLTSYAKGSSGLHQFNGTKWSEISIIGSAMRPNTLFFENENKGWLVDGVGKIFKYEGTTWKVDSCGNTKQLNAISFVDSLNGWTVGNVGTILTHGNSINATPLVLSTTASAVYAKETANSSTTFNIISNTSWTISSDQSTCVVNPTSGSYNATITVTATAANPSAASRTAILTITGVGVAEVKVSATQTGNATSVAIGLAEEVKVFASRSSIIVEGLKAGETVSVYNLLGAQVASIRSFGHRLEIPMSQKSTFIVKTNNISHKVVL